LDRRGPSFCPSFGPEVFPQSVALGFSSNFCRQNFATKSITKNLPTSQVRRVFIVDITRKRLFRLCYSGVAVGDVETAETVRELRDQIAQLTVEVRRLAQRLPAPFVDVATAARALGVCTKTIRRKIETREIPSRRVGGAVRVDISALQPIGLTEVADLAARRAA
jgi:excisionase family DNA binding protein